MTEPTEKQIEAGARALEMLVLTDRGFPPKAVAFLMSSKRTPTNESMRSAEAVLRAALSEEGE